MTTRQTLRRVVERAGIGLHGGLPTRVRLLPATLGSGIRFRTRSGEVPADLAHAAPEPGATVLRAGDVVVRTPEHLLATLAALGVWDVAIELEGDELPALDGSAAGWVDAVDEAGRVPTGPLEPRLPSGVARIEADGVATLEPGASVGVAVAYDDGPSGLLEVPATEEAFRAEVAWARTFVLARDVPRLLAAGRGRGASEANTVVWPTSELRAPDEPVRHKLLDAWGDLALAGPIRARWFVERGHHQLHVHALREALA